MTKRRDSILLASLAIVATQSICGAQGDTQPQQYDAVIVGAGWAGIKAAQTLLDSGVTSSILVLEANNYIGGRSKTMNSDDSINVPFDVGTNSSNSTAKVDNNDNDILSNIPIDLGSEWLYIDNNDMEDYLWEHGFLKNVDLEEEYDHFLPLEYSQFYYLPPVVDIVDGSNTIDIVDGRNYGDIAATGRAEALDDGEAERLRETVWERFLNFREDQLYCYGDQSIASAVEEFKSKTILTEKDLQYLNLIIDIAEVDYTGDIEKLSLGGYEYFTGYDDLDPKHYVSVPGAGYGNIAASFAESFVDKIRLGARVTEINYEDPDNTIVSYIENGVTKEVAAKTVLMTASLGVLKSGSISFNPALPTLKQDAIDNMGFGVMNKCAMTWLNNGDMVWPEDTTWFELITPDTESSGKWTTFFNPSKFKGVPTLVGFIGAGDARDMESQSNETILADVMNNLKSMFPTITQPDRVIITRWGQEPNILGTYSFKTVGRSHEDDSANLRERVDNVWFAGEATAGEWYGSTIGAWQTGETAAREMAEVIAMLPTSSPTAQPTKQPTNVPTIPSTEPPVAISSVAADTTAAASSASAPSYNPWIWYWTLIGIIFSCL